MWQFYRSLSKQVARLPGQSPWRAEQVIRATTQVKIKIKGLCMFVRQRSYQCIRVVALSSLIIGINLTADSLAKALGIDRAQKAPV